MPSPINLTYPLKKSDKGGFTTNDTTLSAVIDDLKILLLTNHGERPGNYLFGANLRKVIFEPVDGLEQIVTDLISLAIEREMPFIVVNEITVQNYRTNSTLNPNDLKIRIDFSVNGLNGVLEQQISG